MCAAAGCHGSVALLSGFLCRPVRILCREGSPKRMLRHAGCARSAILHLISLAGAIALLVAIPPSALAQESSTGNISGTVTGPRGASISGADVTITNKLTGQATHTTTSPAGTYAVRDLAPGDYVIHVQAKGFQPAELLVRIQGGATVTGEFRLLLPRRASVRFPWWGAVAAPRASKPTA